MKRLLFTRIMAILALLTMASGLTAQELLTSDLIAELQSGGKVIVMRHASSPRDLPDAASASQGNTGLERQLDAKGREDARQFGQALQRLGIEIGQAGSSPTFRARETASLAGIGNVYPYEQLGNDNMQESGADKGQWLRTQVSSRPLSGNRLLITHSPNISAAFPDVGRTAEGEALVFDPMVSNSQPIGRIAITAWPEL